MFRLTAILLTLCLFISCTGARKPGASKRGYTVSFDHAWYVIVEIPIEEAWGNALYSLQAQAWPVEVEDRASLTITTKHVTFGPRGDVGSCDVPRARFSPFQTTGTRLELMEVRCRLNVRLTRLGENETKINTLAEVEKNYAVIEDKHAQDYKQDRDNRGVRTGWQPCESTGEIEMEFFDAFLTRLEPISYDPPVYRRGH